MLKNPTPREPGLPDEVLCFRTADRPLYHHPAITRPLKKRRRVNGLLFVGPLYEFKNELQKAGGNPNMMG